MDNQIKKYIEPTPNLPQRIVQRDGFNAFIHYGINTFIGKEWSAGDASPAKFNPSDQNTDQWCEILQEAGVKSVILTAKHHDGFCLWPTKTTDYNISKSPYKDGKGDVVRELANSCKKHGLKLGIYLSPWDRNNPFYGIDNDKYNDIYIEQLKELLTNYGEIYFIWMDGACGSHLDGKPKQIYDFKRYYETIRQLAPNACISNCAPDVRWVGNEGGFARKSEWNVVPSFAFDTQDIAKKSQTEAAQDLKRKEFDIISEDLGSREFLSQFENYIWYPAEVDVSIRPGWFYHKSQDKKVRSLKNLMHIYYTSVGGNSLLLLNIPPDRRGLFHENDVTRLKELGRAIKSAFAKKAKVTQWQAPEPEGIHKIENANEYDYDTKTFFTKSFYTPKNEANSYEITLDFDNVYNIDKVLLIENVAFSQRIESYKIYTMHKGKEKLVYKGTTIGFKRIALFKKAYKANGIKIIIDSCRSKPYIEHISAYETDGFIPKQAFYQKLVIAIHRLSYRVYVKREQRKNKKLEN